MRQFSKLFVLVLIVAAFLPTPALAGVNPNFVTVCAYVDSDKDGIKDGNEPLENDVQIVLFRIDKSGRAKHVDSFYTQKVGCGRLFFKTGGDYADGSYGLMANVFADYDDPSLDNLIYSSTLVKGITVADAGRTFTVGLYSLVDLMPESGDEHVGSGIPYASSATTTTTFPSSNMGVWRLLHE